MTVAAEFLGVIYAYALDRNRQFAHLAKINRIAVLHVKLHRIKQLTQYEPDIRSFCRTVLLNHRLDVFK